jgi:hypothetical protein
MVWFFERGSESFSLETRYDNDTTEFLLIRHRASGVQQIERFADALSFQQRLEILEKQLAEEQWTQHGPTFLHDGWKMT